MKSVGQLKDHFGLVYSGESGQEWMNNVNELERQHAVKHMRIPRQFCFALTITLTGKAKETLVKIEKGPEKSSL